MATTISTDSPKLTANIADHANVYGGFGLNFDGATDYLLSDDNGNAMGMGSNPYSISAWVKVADATNNQTYTYFSACSVGNTQPRFLLQVTTLSGTNSLKAIYEKSTSNLTVSIDEPMDTEWHHLVFVEESDAIRRFYKDGKLVGTDTTSYETDTGYVDYVMGNARTINQWFDGSMSDVKLFNTALSLEQIQELYLKPEQSAPSAVQSNLKVWYPMCEGLAQSVVYDHSGNNHHAVEGGGSSYGILTGQEEPTISQVPLLRYNEKMVFDGVDDECFLDLGSSAFGEGDQTLSAWFNASDLTGIQAIFGAMHYNASSSFGHGIILDGTTLHGSAGGGSTVYDNLTHTVSVNKIYHVAFVRDATNDYYYLYVNGALADSYSSSIDPRFMDAYDTWIIGRAGNATEKAKYFQGIIDECSVFNTDLSNTEVAELYNSGLALDATAHSKSGNLVGYWRNDGVTKWKDRSTNSNDGEVQGTPNSIVIREGLTSGKDGFGFPFKWDTKNCFRIPSGTRSGTDPTALVVPDSEPFNPHTGSFSIEFWVRSEETNQIEIIEKQGTGGGYQFIANSSGASNKIRWEIWDADGVGDITIDTTSDFNDGDWHHIVGIRDYDTSGGIMQIWFDGSQEGSNVDASSVDDVKPASDIWIGGGNTAKVFQGIVDEVRYYSKALSSAEISKNYKHGLSKHKN